MAGIHWINIPTSGRLAIMARPRAGDWLSEEIAQWKNAGIDVVVSLLEIQEVTELGLQREAELCRSGGIEFVSFPIPDRGVPFSESKTKELVTSIFAYISAGRSVAIHCRAGIGRSSVIAACALASAGLEAGAAFSLIARARGLHVPDTDEQRDWVSGFATFVTKGTNAK